MLKINDNYKLENLVKDYGFEKAYYSDDTYKKYIDLYPNEGVPTSDVTPNEDIICEILVNPWNVSAAKNEVRIYFNNPFKLYDVSADGFDMVTAANQLDLLFDMIKDGVIVKE